LSDLSPKLVYAACQNRILSIHIDDININFVGRLKDDWRGGKLVI
jgi:hypothetical protein